MNGHGLSQIKCELSSEEEDSNSQFAHSYLNSQQSISELRPVKLEPDSVNGDVPSHLPILQDLQGSSGLDALAPAGPAATPVCVKQERAHSPQAATLHTLHSTPRAQGAALLERHMALLSAESGDSCDFMPLLVKDEPLSEGEQHTQSGDDTSDSSPRGERTDQLSRASPKSWTQQDMNSALDALRNHNMSLTKASATYGIPSTTLWQRAHRLGIDTPKKEGGAKSWSDADLRRALHALRAGAISANKASKAYGIPSSTLYKIARREGIRLAAPFNAAPTAWRRADLERALAAIRAGAASVQRAAAQHLRVKLCDRMRNADIREKCGLKEDVKRIEKGTLYGRCKREGIELSRSNPTPWSEDAMGEALEAVRVGQMSINQAAIHYNLPYSSLYGRFKRCKYQPQGLPPMQPDTQKPQEMEQLAQNTQDMSYYQQMAPHNTHHLPEEHNHPYVYEHDVHVGGMQEYEQMMYYGQSCSGIAS